MIAVADALGAETVDLLAVGNTFVPGVQFARQQPGRVRRIVAWQGYADVVAYEEASSILGDRGRPIFRDDPAAWLSMTAGMFLGTSPPPGAHDQLRRYTQSNPKGLPPMDPAEWSVEEFLAQVEQPVLVLIRRIPGVAVEQTRKLAAALPLAELRAISGDGVLPWTHDVEEPLRLIDHFLSDEPESGSESLIVDRGLQTILFTDLEASTPLTQRLGDEGAQEILRGHNTTVRGALDEHGGREVKHTGDGIMASFPSAASAVTAALQIQREMAGGEVRVRVGLNAGEPIADDDDLFGVSVIKAARIADRAEPGQVLVSRVVMDLCEGKTFEFASLGAASLKGFDEAVTLFEVRA